MLEDMKLDNLGGGPLLSQIGLSPDIVAVLNDKGLYTTGDFINLSAGEV